MKAKKLLSWFGVLIMMMSTVAVMAGCNHANDNKGNTTNNSNINNKGNTTNNSNSNNNGNTTNNGNIDDGLNIQPTGEAAPALKGKQWKSDSGNLFFDSEGNTAKMYGFDSVYTVNGSTVSFDFSKSAKAWSTLTVKTYIDWQITMENKYIAELEELAKKEQDATKKKKYVCVISSDRQSIKR